MRLNGCNKRRTHANKLNVRAGMINNGISRNNRAVLRKIYQRVVELINLEKLNNSEKVALAHMIDVSVGKRTLTDPNLTISPNTKKAYDIYCQLPLPQEALIARRINTVVSKSIFQNADSKVSAVAYQRLKG